MMTLYITFQDIEAGRLSLDTKVTVSKYAASQPPSRLGLSCERLQCGGRRPDEQRHDPGQLQPTTVGQQPGTSGKHQRSGRTALDLHQPVQRGDTNESPLSASRRYEAA
jgi:hypothetical protein